MDRFGFGDVARLMPKVTSNFLFNGVELARKEMIENIENQSSKESGKSYPELTYYLDWRPKNPPRLVLTGELLNEIKVNRVHVLGNSVVLTIDPIDKKGKGYASYHQDGENQYKDKEEFQSEFVTQSESLWYSQTKMLINEIDKIFR